MLFSSSIFNCSVLWAQSCEKITKSIGTFTAENLKIIRSKVVESNPSDKSLGLPGSKKFECSKYSQRDLPRLNVNSCKESSWIVV